MNASLSALAEEILSRISILAPWVTKTIHPNPLALLIFLKPEFPIKLPTAPRYIPVEGFQPLQGPPGVGKTFLARRLPFALIGEQDQSRVEMVQFHQSYYGAKMRTTFGPRS
jgi:hypothetical protein